MHTSLPWNMIGIFSMKIGCVHIPQPFSKRAGMKQKCVHQFFKWVGTIFQLEFSRIIFFSGPSESLVSQPHPDFEIKKNETQPETSEWKRCLAAPLLQSQKCNSFMNAITWRRSIERSKMSLIHVGKSLFSPTSMSTSSTLRHHVSPLEKSCTWPQQTSTFMVRKS